MFFVIPEMQSKTFVMVLKKLPDHFKRSQDKMSIQPRRIECDDNRQRDKISIETNKKQEGREGKTKSLLFKKTRKTLKKKKKKSH